MSYTIHELTDIEKACGVTLDDVARELPRVLLVDDRVIVAEGLPPALAGAVARCALNGEVEFTGLNRFGNPIYRKA